MVAVETQAESRTRPDVNQGQAASRRQPLYDAERQRRLGAPSDLVHLVTVAEPAAQLVGPADRELCRAAANSESTGRCSGPG